MARQIGIAGCINDGYNAGIVGKCGGFFVVNRFPSDIPALTSLRFFAAIWVALLHFQLGLPRDEASWFLMKGALAVDFFFILSGFILAHSNFDAWGRGEFEFRPFIVKRFARLYPVHFVTLCFFVIIGLIVSITGREVDHAGRYDFAWLIPQVLMVHGWTWIDHGTFNYPSWSISAEWFAYLLFPAIAALVFRKSVSSRVLLGFSIALMIVAFLAAQPAREDNDQPSCVRLV
ncbi:MULTISPECIES: acyltransferase [unclassified Bradyrhizobium]|uniref:acyltransferase family protein n=1 Tax=unclassified Bradyrhizobium TaxID=2631580 RepID=UPI003396B5FC